MVRPHLAGPFRRAGWVQLRRVTSPKCNMNGESSPRGHGAPTNRACCVVWLQIVACGAVIWQAAGAHLASAVPQTLGGAKAVVQPVNARFGSPTDEVPDLRRHIVPLLARLGCSAAACHGAKDGQAGFQLSLFGFDYAADLLELAEEGDPPRANWKDPLASAILSKSTLEEDHEGGKRFEKDGWEYQLLLSWVKARAPGIRPIRKGDEVVSLSIQPAKLVFDALEDQRQVRVIAEWTSGETEDVTPLCRFQSNDPNVAEVTPEGIVTAHSLGDTSLVVFYDKAIGSAAVLAPRSGGGKPPQAAESAETIDAHVDSKLAELGLHASPVCSDEEFLRRATLDVTGTLPTADQVRRFLADSVGDKRATKIEELLASPGYAAWWTTWLCDLTGNNEALMPDGGFGREQSKQWYDWIFVRVAGNVPYDKLVEGLVVSESRLPAQSYEEYCREMTSYVRQDSPEEFASRAVMPYFWARTNLTTAATRSMAFSYAFLGVQIQCAECHKHPFDRWTKEDFDSLTAFFERLRYGRQYGDAAEYQQIIAALGATVDRPPVRQYPQLARAGTTVPWDELYFLPDAAAGGAPPSSATAPRSSRDKPLDALMGWMRSVDHPYMAVAFVNRVWHRYFGVGVVDPPDDLNLANPPSNQPLLDYLARGFIDSGYDMKWLHREILNSQAYQRSARTNETNVDDQRNFSHARVRRLPAEVLYDAVGVATANDQSAAVTADWRAVGPAAGFMNRNDRNTVLASIGKPARVKSYECERNDEPNLAQAMFLQNDPEIHQMLDSNDGWIGSLKSQASSSTPSVDEHIRECYFRTLSRAPDAQELKTCQAFVQASANVSEGLRGVMWVLVNSKEFCLNH